MTDAQLSEVVKTLDEMEPLQTGTRGTYYVLAECRAGRENRIILKDLKQQLPLEQLRQKQPDYHDDTSVYVEAEGSFYPDYLEENGVYLVSVPFYEYLNNTLRLRRIKYNHVGICTEKGERIEEYCLIIPQEIDCILEGSARYDQTHSLTYFEIDETKVGKVEIFRVKGFPHLIVTRKLNRIDFAGYQCTRIEKFFNYAGEQKRVYRERCSGQRLEATVKEYEKRVDGLGSPSYKYGLQRVLDQKKLRQELADGLREIFGSYQGTGLTAPQGMERYLTLFWPREQSVMRLMAHTDFGWDSLNVPALEKLFAYLKLLPEVLQELAGKVLLETVIYCLSQEGCLLDHYQTIHNGQRLALVMETDYFQATIPLLLYEYQPTWQWEVEAAVNFSKMDLNGRDLQGVDFSGKNLSGLQFSRCNLQRANFNGAVLERAEFNRCNLTGAEFTGCNLLDARFIKCELNRTVFDGAEMEKVIITGSDLSHCSFVKTDMTGGLVKNLKLARAYFYRAKLAGAEFKVRMTTYDCIFRQCDLKGAKFTGDVKRTANLMSGCDFRNSDLTECQFSINRIAKSIFTKTKLIGADFTKCGTIQACNFQWSNCAGLNLEGIEVVKSNFAKVDLTMLKVKNGTEWIDNNFTYANLSGYDFTIAGYTAANNLTCTNLSHCNLEAADLTASTLLNTNFTGAKMNRAILDKSQLEWVRLSAQQRNQIRLAEEDEAEDDVYDETDDESEDYVGDFGTSEVAATEEEFETEDEQ